MDPLSIVALIVIILSLFMSAFYSGTETAFTSLNKYKYKVMADDGSKLSKLILWLYEHYETTIIAVLIGNSIFNVALSTLASVLALHFFSVFISDSLISLLTSIAVTLVVYLFGETLPKVIAKRIPDGLARINAIPMAFFVILFYPLTMVFSFFNFLVKAIFRDKIPPELTQEDFQNVVVQSEKQGVFEDNESDIIQASLEFADTSVKEVLTPKSRMFMIDAKGLTKPQLLEILKNTNYSRIPVYYESKDRIIGILIVKNYLNAYFNDHNVSFFSTLQKPYFISPRIMIDDLIEGFRNNKTQIAIVRKEDKVLGMVTTEDVLEELVGKIAESTKDEEGKR